ncbi:MAG: glycosyltransferase family 4 protein [Gammaproteobacteria bacterium]|nr:glycosyltransferase family 4 protein [Gammaproteobacteria bacterium]
MKRVLMLAYYFPPIAASGSLRPLGFCQHLEENGYIPYIVSTDPQDAHPPVNQDADLLERIPAAVRVDRLTHPNRLRQLLELRDGLRGGESQAQAATQAVAGDSTNVEEKRQGLFKRIKTAVLNRLFLFPDHQKPWIKAVEKHVLALPADEQPDIVFATGNPWSGLVAGMRVAKKLGVPFVADFRDPWTRNPKPAVSEAIHQLSCKLEKQVVEAADLVIANTESLKQQFIDDYPEIDGKVKVLTNGYGEHLIDLLAAVTGPELSAPYELCHYGSVYELRKPDRLLEAMSGLVEQGRLQPGQLIVRFRGHWGVEDADCNTLADALEQAGFISREPALAHQDYLKAMKQSQYLLILQQDFPLQIPGKLYEYIATGRPVVMIGGRGATAQLIEAHRLGLTLENEPQALAEFLSGLAQGRCELHPPTPDAVSQFGYASLTRELASHFDQLLQRQDGTNITLR